MEKINAKYYTYFFTRQDISPEQQLVQTAHVALKLGVNSAEYWDQGIEEERIGGNQLKQFNPDNTYFTCVGVRNQDALYAVIDILNRFGFAFEVFAEPDLASEITSIAVYPVHEDHKGVLNAFNLLKMGTTGFSDINRGRKEGL